MARMVNLGPLTTPFVLQPDCSAALETNFKYWSNSPSYYLLQGPVGATSCFPSGYNGEYTQFYSPAVCPQGYTPACTAFQPEYPGGASTETIYTCCPTKYAYECRSRPWYEWQSTLECTVSEGLPLYTTITSLIEVSGRFVTTILTSIEGYEGEGLNAYGVQVRFKSGDFITTTITMQSTLSSTVRTTTQTLTIPVQTSTAVSDSKPATLSAGAAAGIIVASGVSGAALLASIAFFVHRRKGRNQSKVKQETMMSGAIITPAENATDTQEQPATGQALRTQESTVTS
ncbi:hypothetical protein F5Y19DRAFT_149775 [Xylariaceae sp. FL1651]|nr:hypothetical protein F5Y19DRAFT_149775 [Xylariaceae sp. FL1651]